MRGKREKTWKWESTIGDPCDPIQIRQKKQMACGFGATKLGGIIDENVGCEEGKLERQRIEAKNLFLAEKKNTETEQQY